MNAEAELHAVVAASAEVLGFVGLCRDMGMELVGEIYADSSVALGISNGTGAGKGNTTCAANTDGNSRCSVVSTCTAGPSHTHDRHTSNNA